MNLDIIFKLLTASNEVDRLLGYEYCKEMFPSIEKANENFEKLKYKFVVGIATGNLYFSPIDRWKPLTIKQDGY